MQLSRSLTLTTCCIMVIGVWLPCSQLADALGFAHVPPLYWAVLRLTLLAYMALTQIVKTWLLRKKWI